MFRKLASGAAGVCALLGVSTLALATDPGIDTTAALASIGDAVTAISAVGLALIGAAAVVMALRWTKAMFF